MALQIKRKKPARDMYVIPAHRLKEETLSHLLNNEPTQSEASFHHNITHISDDWTSLSSEEDLTVDRKVIFKTTPVVKETRECFNNDSNNLIITKENYHDVRMVVMDNEQQQPDRVVYVKDRDISSSDCKIQVRQQTRREDSLRITSTKNCSIMSDLDIYQMTRSLVLKEKYLAKEKDSCLETSAHLSQMSPNAVEFKCKEFQEFKNSNIDIAAENESTNTTSKLNKTSDKMPTEMDKVFVKEVTVKKAESRETNKSSVKAPELNRTPSENLNTGSSEWIRTISFKQHKVAGSEPSKMQTKGSQFKEPECDKVESNIVADLESNRLPCKDLNSEVSEWTRTIFLKDTKAAVSEKSETPGKETVQSSECLNHHSNAVAGSESIKTPSKGVSCTRTDYSNQGSIESTDELKNTSSMLSNTKEKKINSDTEYRSPLSVPSHAFTRELSCSDVKKNLLKDLSNVGSEVRQRNISQDSGISVSSYDVGNTESNISIDTSDLLSIPNKQPHSTTKDFINIMKTETTHLNRIQGHLLINGVKNLSNHMRHKNSKKLKKMLAFRDLLSKAAKGQQMSEDECVQLFKYIMIRIWNKRSYWQLAKICACIIKKHHDKGDQDTENQSGPTFPKILLDSCEDLINDFPSVKKQHYCHWRDFLSFLKVLYQDVQELSKSFPKSILQTLINAGYITS